MPSVTRPTGYTRPGSSGRNLEHLSIHRRGSLIYARAYRNLVALLALLYLFAGAVLALIAARVFNTVLAGLTVFGLVLAVVATMWLFYRGVIWVFEREARQSIDLTPEGIREMQGERERDFIPWDGVREIEIAATLMAGGSVRVRGNFSEIAVSNVDLVITGPMPLREMHRAMGRMQPLLDLLAELRRRAPQAAFKMNRLARRRMSKYGLSEV